MNLSQILPKHGKCIDRLGKSLEYTTRPKKKHTGTTKTPRSKQINFTRTSPLGLGDAKFTLIHWRNCLEELVPEVKENTRLGDQPDSAAGEALASKRMTKRRRWRVGGRGWKNCQSGQFTLTPLFIWTNRRTGLSGPNLDQIFRPPDNLA
jgi:hypothetical protein